MTTVRRDPSLKRKLKITKLTKQPHVFTKIFIKKYKNDDFLSQLSLKMAFYKI